MQVIGGLVPAEVTTIAKILIPIDLALRTYSTVCGPYRRSESQSSPDRFLAPANYLFRSDPARTIYQK